MTKALLTSLDTAKSREAASEEVRQMVGSMAASTSSQTVQAGSYTVYLNTHSNALGTSYEIWACHKDEVNAAVDKGQYRQFTGDEMLAPLNKEEKAVLAGVIVDVELEREKIVVESSNQDRYHIYYSYEDFVTTFEIGKQYSFYGKIENGASGEHSLLLDYYEQQ